MRGFPFAGYHFHDLLVYLISPLVVPTTIYRTACLLNKILEKTLILIFLKHRAYSYASFWPSVHPYLFYHNIGLASRILLRILKYLRKKRSKKRKKVTFLTLRVTNPSLEETRPLSSRSSVAQLYLKHSDIEGPFNEISNIPSLYLEYGSLN